MRAVITIVVLVCGVLLSAELHRETNDTPRAPIDVSPLESAELTIVIARDRLSIRGTTTSAAHELALRQLAAEQLSIYELETEFQPAVFPGTGWEPASDRLLYAVAAMDSANAVMTRRSVIIRGVASDAAAFASRVESLRETLPQKVELVTDVVFVRSSASLDELCEKAFSRIVFEPVSFFQSSAEIRQASLVTLDRITEYANDCQDATVAITGHTDSSGDETWNRQLSLARAQSVADHIAANGIDPERLLVFGLGSSVPIADNSTAHGRELNRRIEFELR